MAADALLGRALIALSGMTGCARHLLVLVGERESCLFVVEERLLPRLRIVAGSAIRAQRRLVHIVLTMAFDTGCGGLAVWSTGSVAGTAGEGQVRLFQGEIGKIVTAFSMVFTLAC